MAGETIRVALVQKPPVFLNREASIERAAGEIAAAGEAGAQLVAFPECWLPGYPVWIDEAPGAALWDAPGPKALYRLLTENSVEIGGAQLDSLAAAAAEASADVVIGVHERLGGTLYNSMIFLGADGQRACHRKLVPTYTERLVWGMGDGSTLATLETAAGTVGGLICWEHWMPLARAAMHAKGEALHIAQWPTVNEAHLLASRHYAFEGRCFVLASGCLMSKSDVLSGFDSLADPVPEARALLESIPGPDERLLQRGGSCVAGPDGTLVTPPVFDESAVVTAELALDRLAEERLTLDSAGHYSRPDIFELRVDTRRRAGATVTEASPRAGEPGERMH